MHKNVINKKNQPRLLLSACAVAAMAMVYQVAGSAIATAEERFDGTNEVSVTSEIVSGQIIRVGDDGRYSSDHSRDDYRGRYSEHNEQDRLRHEHNRSHDYDSHAQHEYIHHEHEERERRNHYEH